MLKASHIYLKNRKILKYQTIQYSKNNQIAEIRFNRPKRLNAVIAELYEEVLDALDHAEKDNDVRCIVLTGEGRAFCVGADLKEHKKEEHKKEVRTKADKEEYLQLANRVCERIYKHNKIVVAAVNGYALGAGFEMALSADFILIKNTAEVGLPEVSIGTYMGGAVTHILPRIVGLAAARELVFTGNRINGDQAYAINLATRVFSEESFDNDVREFTAKVATKAPISMAFAKRDLNNASEDYDSRLNVELSSILSCMDTEDWQEGIDAFAEKRTPTFKGK